VAHPVCAVAEHQSKLYIDGPRSPHSPGAAQPKQPGQLTKAPDPAWRRQKYPGAIMALLMDMACRDSPPEQGFISAGTFPRLVLNDVGKLLSAAKNEFNFAYFVGPDSGVQGNTSAHLKNKTTCAGRN
jgi:hypothetical protein